MHGFVPALALALCVCTPVVVVAYKQPYEYLQALQVLATDFTNPAFILDEGVPSPLSDDVVGRIDVTTTFVGKELNIEYLFGLFLEGSLQNSTQLIGTPTTYRIQSAVVEPPVVAVSFIIDISYPSVDLIVPLQIDMFISYDDDMKIQSYDAILRRWGDYLNYVIPRLAPKIAEELQLSTDNETEIVVMKTATDVCGVAMEYCTGENQQYQSYDECFSFMTTEIPFGQPWEGGGNTGLCRYIHKNMVKYRPEVHCPHIGPSGGDMCIARDYVQVTNNEPFNHTLLAYNASFNPADVKGIPAANLAELVKVNMQIVGMTTVAFYSVSCVLYMLILYISAKLVEFFLFRFSKSYPDLTFENQRNTVTYLLDIFYTTSALALQLYASPTLAKRYTFDNVSVLKAAALIISGLYIFELTYRKSMRLPLLIHHFCTVFAIVLLLSVLDRTLHPALIGAGNIWLFQATTEQSVFAGLFMYRLQFSLRATRNVLRFSAVQSFIFKIGFAIYLLVFWAQNLARNHHSADDIALSVLLVTIIALLLCTQIYGAWAVWSLAERVNKSMRKTIQIEGTGTGKVAVGEFQRNKESADAPSMGTTTQGTLTPPLISEDVLRLHRLSFPPGLFTHPSAVQSATTVVDTEREAEEFV